MITYRQQPPSTKAPTESSWYWYRDLGGRHARRCVLVGAHCGGMLICREIGKLWAGVWLASPSELIAPPLRRNGARP